MFWLLFFLFVGDIFSFITFVGEIIFKRVIRQPSIGKQLSACVVTL